MAMKLLWIIVTVASVLGALGIVYVAVTPGDQPLISAASGGIVVWPLCAAIGVWVGNRAYR
jgi:hypothetical protein